MTEDLKEQIRKAQAEMSTWSEDKHKSVRLEGTDLWLSAAPAGGAASNDLRALKSQQDAAIESQRSGDGS